MREFFKCVFLIVSGLMLLVSSNFSSRLSESINGCRSELLLNSAFIKLDALRSLSKSIGSGVEVSVVARWKKQDVLVGASDLEVYEYCRDQGWKFGIDKNFHGKLYIIDQTEIFLGSANLTGRGLGFGPSPNYEFGTVFPAAVADMKKVDSFLEDEVTWLNDELYDAMCADVTKSKKLEEPFFNSPWSDEVELLINTPVNYLWVNDLPFVTPAELLRLDLNCESAQHDFEMLSLDVDRLSREDLISQFRGSRVYSWLINQLSGDVELRFGTLTRALHNALLDDPSPYRKDVKEFLANIFEWIQFMPEEFVTTKHNITTSIRRAGS